MGFCFPVPQVSGREQKDANNCLSWLLCSEFHAIRDIFQGYTLESEGRVRLKGNHKE